MSFLLMTCAFAASQYPPDLHWQQLSTENFVIVFHQGEEEIARHVAGFVEKVRHQVTEFLQYVPQGKTYIILTDHVDYSNAHAIPFPRNYIVLYLRGPIGSADSKNPDYLEYVFTHEYTHIVHLNTLRGIPKLLRKVFGSWMLPNGTTPAWVIEGLPTYVEGKDHHGRAEDPVYDMVLRADILDQQFKRVDEPSDFNVRKWPGGSMRYLYGSKFFSYLAQTYGDQKIAEVNHVYSGQIPYFTSLAYRRTYSKSLPRLWKEWRLWTDKFYTSQLDSLNQAGLTKTVPVTERGYYTAQPVFSRNGKAIYYLHMAGDHYPAIYKINLTTKKSTKIVEGLFAGEQFSVDRDEQKIYFAQFSPFKKFYTYSDVYVYDHNTDKTLQLTHGLRAFDPTISPDKRFLVFVTNNLGSMQIQRMDLQTQQISTLISPKEKTQFSHPTFSPDGKWLVFSIWQKGQLDIAVCTADGDHFRRLTNDIDTDTHPIWMPDGRAVVFYSDRSGVPNLFTIDLHDTTLYQLTNVSTGVFNPAVSSDGKTLAMEHYSSCGYDIHLTAFRKINQYPHSATLQREANSNPVNDVLVPQPYKPLQTILPNFWIPVSGIDAYSDQWGIYAFDWDVLRQHNYELLLLYGFHSNYLSYGFTYTNDRYFPTVTLSISDYQRDYDDCSWSPDLSCGVDYWERVRRANLAVRVPVSRRIRSSTDATFSLLFENWSKIGFFSESKIDMPENLMVPAVGNWTNLQAQVSHTRLESYRYSISPEKGYRVQVAAERADKILGGDFNLWKLTADFSLYLRAPVVRHVVALKLKGGTSAGDFIPQGIYHLGGTFGRRTMALGSRYFQLRGYPIHAFRGRHIVLGSVEYRFPVFFVERGIHSWPVFWDGVSATIFADIGQAWQTSSPRLNNLNHSFGSELHFNFSLLRILPTSVSVGFAAANGEHGQRKWYLRLDTQMPEKL